MSQPPQLTPVMKQYWDLKAQVGDAFLLFRMGDFYELFGEDAVQASAILDLTLTSRDKGKDNPLPMAGMPFHAASSYIQKLLKAGKRVALAEQIEETVSEGGKPAKLVRREVSRILSPGVQFENLDAQANYLCALTIEDASARVPSWTLACLDASTGELRVQKLSSIADLERLSWIPARHWLRIVNEKAKENPHAIHAWEQVAAIFPLALIENLNSGFLLSTQADPLLATHYDLSPAALEGLGDAFALPSARFASALLIKYVLKSQHLEKLSTLQRPELLESSKGLRLGPRSPQHLDLIDSNPCFFDWINRTRSSLGARHLRRWMLEPLRNVSEIEARQAAVKALGGWSNAAREGLRAMLSEAYDLERIASRVATRLASPRDLKALTQTVNLLPSLQSRFSAAADRAIDPTLAALGAQAATLQTELVPFAQHLDSILRDELPLTIREGGVFRGAADPELERTLGLVENGNQFLIELETRERTRTGIGSLKVKYNRVFGYFIEITSTHLKLVPADYMRKQTTVGGERFFTEELKQFEEEMLSSSSRQKALEVELFAKYLNQIETLTPALMRLARLIAEVDTLQSLSELAQERGFSFPELNHSGEIKIEGGFHPLVQESLRNQGKSMVSNDLSLEDPTRLLLITGPNMGGKSTLLRQVALIVLLGQMGAPVPARKARWGVVDAIYTRLGAHDAIARGQSTFMVEMTELACLLREATPRSLLILDEIGRGTSTYDGMSVAWATIEHIAQKIGARSLFATHYHELTDLSHKLPQVENAHLAVAIDDGKLRFQYRLVSGPSSESFGIHVAEMAGIPAPVVARAWDVLKHLEEPASGTAPQAKSEPEHNSAQLSFFAPAPAPAPVLPPEESPILIELKGLRIETLTPLEALNRLAELQGKLSESEPKSSS